MLRLIDASGIEHPISAYSNLHIKHKLDGQDTMSFLLSTTHEEYLMLQEECVVRTAENEYLIKKIDDDKFDCQLNFDFLKSRIYMQYRSETRSLREVLESHLPTGWTIEGANISTIRRTIEFDYCTDYDVVMECMATYGVYFVWHIIEKRIVVYSPEAMQSTGEYVTSELNLKTLSFKGQSTEFATRLYAYGADGMTMENAMIDNGDGGTMQYGLTYVDNNTYSQKTICAYWSDERYSVPEALYDAAVEKLSTLAWPVRSYSCDIVDLAKMDSRYSFLDFAMHKKISLIDIDRGIKVEHQIVQYDEWPDSPQNNAVTLSCVPDTIQTSFRSMVVSNSGEAVAQKIETALSQRITMATAMLTGAFGGYIYQDGADIYLMNTDDPSTAQRVWRWNVNGFGKSSTGIDGPYTTAITFDDTFITDVINAMVIRGSLIEAGTITADKISQSYTNGVLEQSYKAAEGLVEYMAKQINDYLTNDQGTGQIDVLQDTVTKIQQTVNGLLLEFSESYSGGINYIQNSSGLNGLTADWTYTGTVLTLQNSDTKNSTVSNSCFRLSAEATLSQTVDNIIPGESYTISLKIRKTSNLLATVKVIYNGDTETIIFSTSEVRGWAEYAVTLNTVQSSNITIEIFSRGDSLDVADIMLCEGTVQRAWTPAPNEIYTSGVNIDKYGIEVYRSATDEKTIINNREFAGYYADEEVFSLNKDETRIKKTTIRGELTVGDCNFIPFETSTDKGLNIALID